MVVLVFEKYLSNMTRTKVILHTGHGILRYLIAKNDAKPMLIRWLPLLLEFDFEVDYKGIENQVTENLSPLEK